MSEIDELMEAAIYHYGTPRKSGRYPYGSGEEPNQRHMDFLSAVEGLKKKGLSEVEIAKGMGINTSQLRAKKQMAKNEKRKADVAQILRLKDKGMSTTAIGEQMGMNESSVRALLKPTVVEKTDRVKTTIDLLKKEVAEKKYLDVGEGTENHMGINQTQLKNAVFMLKEEGYNMHYLNVQQLGTGHQTKMKVLTAPDVTWTDVHKNQDKIRSVAGWSEDGGKTFESVKPALHIDSKRVGVRYADQGGAEMDGVIQLRRGVPDIDLGNARYAQVRIGVDGTHYLKGMAVYADDLPKGVDMMFNTNKHDTGNKLDAMKPVKNDPILPFGSVVRQKTYVDSKGKTKQSVLNIVGDNEEGTWSTWSKKLSSQMMSKQTPTLAKQQLGLSFDIKKAEFDEINSLTNPAVKKQLLQSFADGADSSAIHLKAAGLPRTANHVILPINSLKDTEIYAPNYRNGEKVVLIRHPHGGIFEIPELTVNNRNQEARRVMDRAKDAVGINHKVAERLSGADFDGDTVLVIPNNNRSVKSKGPLEGLKNFDPKTAYPAYEGMKPMSSRTKQQQMGDVSNLITDMTIKGATDSQIARAVRHSMVVIDAEKHNLNWKQSHADNGIAELKKEYQGGANKGASTLISRAKSEDRVDRVKPRSAAKGGPIDKATGKLVFEKTGETYVDAKGKTVSRTETTTKMAVTDNAFSLVSDKGGTPMEFIYAEHANKLKALANDARKAMVTTKTTPYSPSAKKAYAQEVDSLQAKLNIALKNKPLERQAQLLANTNVKLKKQADPEMDKDTLKKITSVELTRARDRVGAGKTPIDITDREWEAIQAGAITNNKLEAILANSNLDRVRQLATPREKTVMGTAKISRAKAMLARGYDQSEIADALGVSVSTLSESLR